MKKRFIHISIFCLAVTALFTFYFTGNAEKTAPDPKENFIQNVDETIASQHFKGSILLVKNQKVIYKQTYGYSNNDKKIDNRITTAYPIASLQKNLTGIIILQLIQEGRLTEETRLQDFYPEIKNSDEITVKQLLNHTSGIMMDEIEPATLLKTEVEQINHTIEHLDVSDRQDFYYSNANYTLLAGIISKLLESDYQQVVENRIIKKMNLKNTFFWNTRPDHQGIPEPYQYLEEDYQKDDFPNSEKLFSSLLGAGNLFMSVEDMWQVQKGLIDGTLFSSTAYNDLVNAEAGGYQAGFIYFDQFKYSEGNLGGYDTVIYGAESGEDLVILFANQPATNGMGDLAAELYERMFR